MDAFVTPIWEVLKAIGAYSANHFAYLLNLKRNVKSLEAMMNKLKGVSEDKQREVEQEEERGVHQLNVKRTNQLENWLKRVQAVEEKVNTTLEEEKNQGPCCGVSWFPKNCCTSYKLGKKVSKLLNDVSKLTVDCPDKLTNKLPPAAVHDRPMEKTVGLDSKLKKVVDHVQDENVRIIGLYGMPGVGKTTLLNKINNEGISLIRPTTTSAEKGFDMVIWAVVSNTKRDASIEKVQEAIRNRLLIPDDIWKTRSTEEKVVEISNRLKQKRFLLLLDDLWERFDLSGAGIPNLDNGSTVIFTTRSEHVCGQMLADQKIKIECLSPTDALQLFKMNVGEDTLNSHPRIPKFADEIAQKCHGLPLALVTAGRAMASRKNPRNWEHAITTLKKALPKLTGIVENVFPVLKLSYDNLQSDTLKSCFLYCSIFPAHYSIKIDELIDFWIGEGIICESNDMRDARNHGHHIIESLTMASLLQVDDLGMCVTMHDVIREMALWIACDSGKISKIWVGDAETAVESNTILPSAGWDAALERVSLWRQNIEDVTKITYCPNLLTFIAREVNRHGIPLTFPGNFFRSMQSLKVLDLSNNSSLEFLEGIGELVILCYLNLSGTAIRELPAELKKLKKLRVFLLNDMINLKQIAPEVMSTLSSLQLFSKLDSPFLVYKELLQDEMMLLSVLEQLKRVSDICLTLRNESSVHRLLDSDKLNRGTRALSLVSCFDMTSIKGSDSSLQNLETLSIHYCKSLVQALVLEYSFFRNRGYFHNLSDLCIDHCPNLVQVVGGDLGDGEAEGSVDIFSSLKIIRLYNLLKLETIFPRALPFPSLLSVDVFECPNLKQLPFDSTSAKNSLKEITGEQSWWDGLQWEDEETKSVFSSKFHPSVEF